MSDSIGMAILAAGAGTRLGKPYPKPLAPILGQTLVDYVLDASLSFATSHFKEVQTGIVVGHQKELVTEHLKSRGSFDFPVQKELLGTADALKSYFNGCAWAEEMNYTLVMCGDTPLLNSDDFELLWQFLKSNNYDGVAACFNKKNPFGYGRIALHDKGFSIVEEKDASVEEKKIMLVNSGLYLFKTDFLLKKLKTIGNTNKSGEFYLTDAFGEDENVGACEYRDEQAFLGVNDLLQLNMASDLLKERVNTKHLQNGVHLLDPSSTYVDVTCTLSKGTTIYPNTHIRGSSSIGENCVVGVGSIIVDSELSENVHVKDYSHLEGAKLASQVVVGPYARLRPGSVIGKKSKIGNFVEIKKSTLSDNVSVSHLSYVGDAEIDDNVNIGCGFITCNYDGESKHKTIIGKNSFIGSDSQMIAPVNIGESAYVASGSTISKDVPAGSFAICRSRQENKLEMAKRFLKGKWKLNK